MSYKLQVTFTIIKRNYQVKVSVQNIQTAVFHFLPVCDLKTQVKMTNLAGRKSLITINVKVT